MRVLAYDVAAWGTGEIWFDGDVVVNHELPSARPTRAHRGDHPLAERLRAYFEGSRAGFDDVPLELEWCSPFQRAVIDTLRRVPYGETVTYGELAALAGHPNAYRAAGTVCAGNRFPLVVPCHRVVAAGSLGRYGSLGVGYKRRLLELEGVL